MSSIFTSVPKDVKDLTKGFYGAFTPPSNWAAVVHAPDIFARECYVAGSAAVSAAIFELGHIPMRRLYWALTTRGTQFDGRRQPQEELLQHMAHMKIGKWMDFADAKRLPNLRYARLRHARAEKGLRANRARNAEALARFEACAATHGGHWSQPHCSYSAIAADGAGITDGFHTDASGNFWLRTKHVGLEGDDEPVGAELDDDLPVQTAQQDEECPAQPTDADEMAGEGGDEDTMDLADEAELEAVEREAARGRAAAAEGRVTEDEYGEALAYGDDDHVVEERSERSLGAGSNIPADGVALAPEDARDVPME